LVADRLFIIVSRNRPFVKQKSILCYLSRQISVLFCSKAVGLVVPKSHTET
jgi:hypothetical protein